MWQTIEMRELRAFLAVAEDLHFGRAAVRLGVTQSAVSQTVRALETKLGTPLLHRTSRRVTLTDEGERLRARLAPTQALLDEILADTHDRNRGLSGALRLGLLSPTAGGPRLIDIIRGYERAHDGATVIVTELPLEDGFGPLRRREVDLVATRMPVADDDLTVGAVLVEEPRVLAVARTHTLASHESVSLEDVADYFVAPIASLPRESIEAMVPSRAPSGRAIRRLGTPTRTVAEVMNLVARGDIVHPTVPSLAEYFGHPDVRYVPLTGMPTSKSALVWLAQVHNPRARTFNAFAVAAQADRPTASRTPARRRAPTPRDPAR